MRDSQNQENDEIALVGYPQNVIYEINHIFCQLHAAPV